MTLAKIPSEVRRNEHLRLLHHLFEQRTKLRVGFFSQPDAGALDPGTGGLRKVRIPDPARGKGKRSGARVHYLWLRDVGVVYLMFVYTKDEASTLTPGQKRELRVVVEAIKNEWAKKGQGYGTETL